ncbi:MAG: NAD+ synthase [Nitrospirae bacterium RIFCSPHIGHO2_01_FULL_66_17]|nr:MAG: NAD+ synthase [Nitrospirae bacterium RIFCSPHIGHO2_01_FULL_66_17]
MRRLRLALAQMNSTVGDLDRNAATIRRLIGEARRAGADLVAFPEMALPGYPPEDLLLKPQFIRDNLQALDAIAPATRGLAAIVGVVDRNGDIFNAAAVLADGRRVGMYHKMYLPNYGVFDEDRYFQAGRRCAVFRVAGVTVGVNICEDIWYPEGPTQLQALAGEAEVIVNINASPYSQGKGAFRERMYATRAADNLVMVAAVNMVGAQDELVFDGHSVVVDQHGALIARGGQFVEELLVVDLDVDAVFQSRLHDTRRRKKKLALLERDGEIQRFDLPPLKPRPRRSRPAPAVPALLSPEEEVYRALTVGVRDYVAKNGFETVVIGVSGGIDSALTTAIAVDALGAAHVVGVFMPSPYTSVESREDVDRLAKRLGVRLITLPIHDVMADYHKTLSPTFGKRPPDIAEENIQARIRGNLLMALSNKFGWLVLTTGNKSEMSVGYTTLYGDMAGGFAVIKDVPKTLVYALARFRNRREEVIPQRVLDRAPTAELRPHQRDEDTLPPYAVLDPILRAYVEDDRSVEDIVAMGYPRATVAAVARMVDGSEYKRRQSPIGIKLTPRALGKDRRMPVTNRYRER